MQGGDVVVPSDDPPIRGAAVAGLHTASDSSASLLMDEIGRLVAGAGDPRALVAALRTARLYCVRGDHVGFTAIGPPGAAMVPVFTSEEQLALFAGESAWFCATGADLLGMLPPGYDVAVDLGGAQPVRLHADLWSADAGLG